MNFIERLVGICADGGSGLFEILLFLIPLLGIAMLLTRPRSASAPPNPVGMVTN